MKILYYSPHPHLNLSSPSGYGRHMREVIKAFEKAGHKVIPVIMGGTELAHQQLAPGKNSFRQRVKKWIPSVIWETLKDISLIRFDDHCEKKLADIIHVHKPDLIYERANYLQLSGVRAARKCGIKHFLEVNAPYVEERQAMSGLSLLRYIAGNREAQQLRDTDKVFVVSEALKNYFSKKHDIDPGKIESIPNAINPEDIRIDSLRTADLSRELGIGDRWVIGFVGSIFPYHGVDVLIDAFAGFIEKFPQSLLLIVGDGETLPQLKEKTRNYNIEQQVIFTGSVSHDRVFDYISLMHVTVMARSNWYGSPVKIFEYGYMGKPIIAPDTQPVREVMEDGRDGVIIASEVNALCRALAAIRNDYDKYCRMAEHFKKKVEQSHTWNETGRTILRQFDRIS